jgi:hypothetical protein
VPAFATDIPARLVVIVIEVTQRHAMTMTKEPQTERTTETELLRKRRIGARVTGWLFPILAITVFTGFGIVLDKLDFLPPLLAPPRLHRSTEIVVVIAGAVLAIPYLFALWRMGSVSNRLAEMVCSPPSDVPGRPYVLLLRSFFLDQTLKAGSVGFWPSYRDNESLQERLASALRDHEVVKIGRSRPFDWYGGSVISSNADWEQRFLALAERASLIVMCPVTLSSSSGTYRELSEIVDRGWLAKTVMIAPPTKRWVWLRGRDGLPGLWSVRRLWEETRKLTTAIPELDLPQRRSMPGALLVRNGSQWTTIVGVLGRDWDHPASLNRLLVRGLGTVGPLLSSAHLVKSLVIFFVVMPLLVTFVAGLWEMRDGGPPSDTFLASSYLIVAVTMLLPFYRVCRRHMQHRVNAAVLAAMSLLGAATGLLLYDRLSYLYGPVHSSLGILFGTPVQGAALVAVALASACVTALASAAGIFWLTSARRLQPPPLIYPR